MRLLCYKTKYMNQYTNKYTDQDYINKCNDFGVSFCGTNRHPKKGMLINFICPIHKDKGTQSIDWSHFKNKKRACPYCSGKRDTEDAQKLIKNPHIKFISEYNGAEKPVRCECSMCGSQWISNHPIDLFRRDCGCPTCGKAMKALHRRKSSDSFVDDLSSVNNNITVIGEYTGAHKKVRCRCNIDGYEWESYACNLLNKSAGCPKCNMSVGENMIIEFMQKHKITHSRQKTFPECSDSGLLRFDIFDEDNNIAIEFQGEQHYYPIDFSGMGYDNALMEFQKLQKRDSIKKAYCEANKITLICIPYYERGNIDAYLMEHVDIYKERYIA